MMSTSNVVRRSVRLDVQTQSARLGATRPVSPKNNLRFASRSGANRYPQKYRWIGSKNLRLAELSQWWKSPPSNIVRRSVRLDVQTQSARLGATRPVSPKTISNRLTKLGVPRGRSSPLQHSPLRRRATSFGQLSGPDDVESRPERCVVGSKVFEARASISKCQH